MNSPFAAGQTARNRRPVAAFLLVGWLAFWLPHDVAVAATHGKGPGGRVVSLNKCRLTIEGDGFLPKGPSYPGAASLNKAGRWMQGCRMTNDEVLMTNKQIPRTKARSATIG